MIHACNMRTSKSTPQRVTYKKSTTQMHMRRSQMHMHKHQAYQDNVDFSTHENVFYMYKIGRYHNKTLYTYGETTDLMSIEIRLRRHVPMYELVFYAPYETKSFNVNQFLEDCKGFQATLPLHDTPSDWNILYIEDEKNVQDIIASYKTREQI